SPCSGCSGVDGNAATPSCGRESVMNIRVVMTWSGGKDSAVALHTMLNAGEHEVVAQLTSVSEEYRRSSHHGVQEARLEQQLAKETIAMVFKSYLSCVEGKLGPGFVGRPYDHTLLASLPAGIDPCGEYGEFHTFVYDGPIFKRPVQVSVGDIVIRDGRHYADL